MSTEKEEKDQILNEIADVYYKHTSDSGHNAFVSVMKEIGKSYQREQERGTTQRFWYNLYRRFFAVRTRNS